MGTSIIIGFASGVIASFFGRSFVLSIMLGIVGALGARFIGQKIGWFPADSIPLIGIAAGAAIAPVIGRLFAALGNLSCLDG